MRVNFNLDFDIPLEPDSVYDSDHLNPEHADDRKMRYESMLMARKHGAKFITEHLYELIDCVITYGDQLAIDKLELLRDEFWGEYLSNE